MKSRTSCFNLTVFKKDITRFAPCWGLYTLMLLLGLFSLSVNGDPYNRACSVVELIRAMTFVNLCYGLVTAQLLFGDLYNSRLCNALHAMPLRRESWFLTHTLSGLAFSLIPNTLICLIGLPMLWLGYAWSVVFWWLLAVTLQYLFFFGLAVLCMMLTGNRFAQIVIYAIVNSASLLAGWLIISIYQPLLYGIQINDQPFLTFCPLYHMTELDLIEVLHQRIEDHLGNFQHYEVLGITSAAGWGYLTVCALIGVAALVLGLSLYRRRKLECAGDFLAFRATEPVFLVIITIFSGVFFQLFSQIFISIGMEYIFLTVGMVIGFFGGLMLLRRTTRVFRSKAFGGLIMIVGAFALSLVLTAVDPIGITRRVPELSQVKSVTVSNSSIINHHSDFPFTLEESEDIQAILDVHQDAIDRKTTPHPDDIPNSYYMVNIRLEYQLENGKTINRFYSVATDSEAGKILEKYFTSIECILGITEEEIPKLAGEIRYICSNTASTGDSKDPLDIHSLDIEGLLRAIAADCHAGNMIQLRAYHYANDARDERYDLTAAYLELGRYVPDAEFLRAGSSYPMAYINVNNRAYRMDYTYLDIYYTCENTLKWMEENGFYTPEDAEK